ncbi:alpha-hydroxy acid oxidase [Gordonia terrae]|uniref:Alpha-hydroxy-acid oxidizing enzyme n=2 Tax=Gordonia terrae TaxID=2055 RepID=A0AAD0K910_9ACTN|nr:alpha-hydroxy acid oxidase [Gordonia terrae]VTR09161.1 L-lactate dehydrogenase [Clostridioides difficile]ANY21843.1 alpha-hydroxy-acid oxidizing enzyme [Gordonia terrae]AWO82577.1 alpha-hydroxy-acid oxidizing enzyme [Gordonia terrae]VTS22140.1 L-lactate dehydrogenase [cytochrome] [Gordonia terrae]GAB44654.1 putative L-lactate dehydrogenase [Gordonia terrae NBRC 100016]
MKIGPFDVVPTRRDARLDIADYRAAARRRLPRPVWAYVENGADDGRTTAANAWAWSRWNVRQRVLAGVPSVDTATTVVGDDLGLPILLAPVGLAGAVGGAGDLAAVEAAERVSTRAILSTGSTHSLEEVGRSATSAGWFQLYPWGDRNLTGSLIDRARAAGFGTLVVTVDVPVVGNRLGERRFGMNSEPWLSPAVALHYAARPRWLLAAARHRRFSLANLSAAGDDGGIAESVRRHAIAMRPDLSWDDLAWMRARWDGPVVVKGVLDGEDAARAVDSGAEGVIVSNHGGRQLAGTLPTARALVDIVDRVGCDVDVLVDGGIRSGSDVVVALALGARAVLIGRPWLYGLAVGGVDGVSGVLDILDSETRRTAHLMGVSSLRDLSRSHLACVEGEVGDLWW